MVKTAVQPTTYQAKMVQVLAAHPDGALATLARAMQGEADLYRGQLLTVGLGYVADRVAHWVGCDAERAAERKVREQELAAGSGHWPGLGSAPAGEYATVLFWALCCLGSDEGAWRRLVVEVDYQPPE
jgi:hypothetical protein